MTGAGGADAPLRREAEMAGYRIERFVARGGMGAVYEAMQLSLDRRVALKFISGELGDDERFRERFRREARLAAAIDDPHILPVYEAGELPNGRLFLALRFVDGPDLNSLLREQALELDQAVTILTQVGEALDAAHARGLIHRDVKPANVMLDPRDGRWHAYLTDFGLAKPGGQVGEHTATGELLGTIDYMAPEQINGEALDGRTDVYSFGCMVYRCLAGEAPYRRESRVATMMAHLNAPVPLPSAVVPGLPRALDIVVQRSMEKDVAQRARSAGALMRWAAEQMRSNAPSQTAADESPTEAPAPALPATEPTRVMRPRAPSPGVTAGAGRGGAAGWGVSGAAPPGWSEPAAAAPQRRGGRRLSPGAAVLAGTIAIAIAAAAVAATLLLIGGPRKERRGGSPARQSASSQSQTGNAHGRPALEGSATSVGATKPEANRSSAGSSSAGSASSTTPSKTQSAGESAEAKGEAIAAPLSLETYYGPGYVASAPSEWTELEDGVQKPGYKESKWREPGESSSYALIDSSRQSARTPYRPESPEEEAQPVHRDLEREDGYEELAYRTIELDGTPTEEWVFRVPGSERVDYFFQKCTNGFAVLGSAKPASFASLAPTFEAIAESVVSTCE